MKSPILKNSGIINAEIEENVTIVRPVNIYGCKIGKDCFIGHGVMFINDSFSSGGPAGGNKDLWKDTFVGDNVSIGSNSTIMPVKICNDVVIGAGSVVTKDIDSSGIYAGNPAKLIRKL